MSERPSKRLRLTLQGEYTSKKLLYKCLLLFCITLAPVAPDSMQQWLAYTHCTFRVKLQRVSCCRQTFCKTDLANILANGLLDEAHVNSIWPVGCRRAATCIPVAEAKERDEAVLAVFSKVEILVDTSASWKD